MKKVILVTLAVLLFLGAAGVTVYPLVSNYVNDKNQSVVRSDYARQITELDAAELNRAKEAAKAYNDSLSIHRYNREAVEQASVNYADLLNLNGSGIMGYVEVPRIQINLPIYHGTGESVLEKGVGHLVGSSLPIGGAGYHSVLTGHSGVAGKRLFSDIDQLRAGDVFYLHILDETLAYQVVEINKVLPHETELLAPVAGEDLCTLITCYPYGVNTHRLLVRGSRIPYEAAVEIEEAAEDAPVKSTWKEQYVSGLVVGGGIALAVILVGTILGAVRRKRRNRHAER